MNQKPKKIAFFGTPPIAVIFLDALVAAGMKPALVVTAPDKPVGRGLVLTAPSVKVAAQKYNIPVFQPDAIDEKFMSDLSSDMHAETGWDVFVVVAYGMILPEKLINLPKHSTLNVHFSLLPRWRGASPVESAILAGDTETGVAIQVMHKALDSGPLIATESTTLYGSETAPELRARLGDIGARLLIETLPRYLAGAIPPQEQDESFVTKSGKMKKEDGELLETDSDETKWRKYRAYYAWPGTYFFTEKDGKKIRIKIISAEFSEGTFRVLRVIPEGKREMSYEDFLRG